MLGQYFGIDIPLVAETVGRALEIISCVLGHSRTRLSSGGEHGRIGWRGTRRPTRRHREQDVESPQLFAVVVPAGEVLVEQRFERRALEPIGDRVRARQQDVAAPLAEEGADQGADRHGKAVLLAVDDRRRQIAARQPLQDVFPGPAAQFQPRRQRAGIFGKAAVEKRARGLRGC